MGQGLLRSPLHLGGGDTLTIPGMDPISMQTKYLGISDHVELQILLQLVLVVLVEQEILLFGG